MGGFFVWHAFHGERGIAADLETRREMAEVEAKLKVIRAEKADWQRRVDLLRGPVIDRDLLDEEALHFGGIGDHGGGDIGEERHPQRAGRGLGQRLGHGRVLLRPCR